MNRGEEGGQEKRRPQFRQAGESMKHHRGLTEAEGDKDTKEKTETTAAQKGEKTGEDEEDIKAESLPRLHLV